MIKLDCSYGEGGGQIIRTALALSAITGKPFSAYNIRKSREEPGLKQQHLHCIKSLQELCSAKASGAFLGSDTLEFVPGKIKSKSLHIDIGTAGSVSLLLQSLVLPAMFSEKKVKIEIKGGTSGKWAMPFEFFVEVLVPQLKRFADIKTKLVRRGYFPQGGGEVEVIISPKKEKPGLIIMEQGKLLSIKGISHASLDLEKADVAERQAKSARFILNKYGCPISIQSEYANTLSTGSGISLWAIFSLDDEMDVTKPIRIGADSLGERGKSSEIVGKEAAEKLMKEINSKAPIDSCTADNLIPFLAVFGGRIKVSEITQHTLSNIWVCQQFLEKDIKIEGNVISCEAEPKSP